VSVTAVLNPPMGATATVNVADWPGLTVAFVGEDVTPKSAPWPASATVWGLPGALSAIDNVAVSDPDVSGLKLMAIVQVPPTPILGEQGVFEVRVKSAASVPEIVTLVMLTAASPVLVTTNDWLVVFVLIITLPKFRLAAETLTFSLTPLPLRGTVCVLPVASVTVRVAVAAPAAAGAKVTEITQLASPASDDPQVFVWLKSAVFAPIKLMLVIPSAADPKFCSVTV
jgi:hypothetical protein